MKWVRRIAKMVLALLVSLLILAIICHHLLHIRPDWYGRSWKDPLQREEAASRVEDKLVDASNWSAATFLARGRRATARPPDDALEISLTDEQINAIISKWEEMADASARTTAPFADPQIMFPDGQIVLAVTSRQLDSVITVQVEPRVDERGMLQLRVMQVLCGRLPLPQRIWEIYARPLASEIAAELPGDQSRAKMFEDGSVNDEMISAVLGRAVLRFLGRQNVNPIFFIPFVQNNRSGNLPVKLTRIEIKNKTATITLKPLEDRAAVIGALNQ